MKKVTDVFGRADDRFTVTDLTKIFGTTRSTIQQWIDSGFIVPSIQRSDRGGIPNLFSRGDLYVIRLFQELLQIGLKRPQAGVISAAASPWGLMEMKKRYCTVFLKRSEKGSPQLWGSMTYVDELDMASGIRTAKGQFTHFVGIDLLPLYAEVNERVVKL